MPVASIARPIKPAERVDLSNQVPLRSSTNGRVAGHVRNGAVGQRAEPDMTSKPRRRPRGFHPGVTGTDNHYIERTHDYLVNDF